MRRKPISVVILTVVLAITFIGVGIAAELTERAFAGSEHRRHRDGGLKSLSRTIHQNMAVQVLSEISGQPVEKIREQVEGKRLRAVLDDYNIDRQVFQTAMRSKNDELIRSLVESGYITATQQKNITEKMDRHLQRRELINRLIEKGIEDGTITSEQALVLSHKRR
jgi:hypothetical protein